ncbi:MAG: hypothetical protein HDS89_03550 [Bacteroidales bacterium]|nr:hypothetical protein [Bacteroidales bacterium]
MQAIPPATRTYISGSLRLCYRISGSTAVVYSHPLSPEPHNGDNHRRPSSARS